MLMPNCLLNPPDAIYRVNQCRAHGMHGPDLNVAEILLAPTIGDGWVKSVQLLKYFTCTYRSLVVKL